jgi:hypothetical protein
MRYKEFGRHTGSGPNDGNKASALAGQATLHLRCLLSECESWIYIVFALTIQYPDIVSGYCMVASKVRVLLA